MKERIAPMYAGKKSKHHNGNRQSIRNASMIKIERWDRVFLINNFFESFDSFLLMSKKKILETNEKYIRNDKKYPS